jgi:hypothetical protein
VSNGPRDAHGGAAFADEGTQRFRARAFRALGTALVGICLASVAAGTDELGTYGCAWGPIRDLPAVQTLLGRWADSTGLAHYDVGKLELGIDGSRSRLMVPFAKGTLTLAWDLDPQCEPVAITVSASPDYEGPRPDESAVKQLVSGLSTLTVVPQRQRPPLGTFRMLFFLAASALLAGLLAWAGRRWHAAGVPPWPKAASARIRLLGLLAIVALLPYRSPTLPALLGDWLDANTVVLIGVLPLFTVLWLTISGYFGYGSARRDDWPALVVFVFALALRLGFARHGVEGNVLHFGRGGFDSHSVVYAFYLLFLHPLARDPFKLQMRANAVLGALAVLPLYLFIRQRTGSRTTAVLVTTFYAVHPILLQMAPTDSPYSLCFATWFTGLALLSNAEIGARQLVGSASLLGIAATCRPEGGLFLAASLLLIDVRALLGAVRRHLSAAALSAMVVLGLLAVEIHFIFSTHMGNSQRLPVDVFTIEAALKAGLWSTDYNDMLIVILVVVGAVAGLVNGRLRIGLGAAVGALIVVWPFCATTYGGYIILHRLSAACALQSVAAGVGAGWIASWLPGKLREHWVSAVPAVLVALHLLIGHRHEIHDPHGLSDEFWMLRNNLAPRGIVKSECQLVWVGRRMDTDIHNFEDVVPGMKGIQCQERDCLADIAKGGCFYYMRGLNCFYSEEPTKRECLQHGKTSTGGYMDCIDPQCVQVETSLELELVEQRTVDVHSIWNYERGTPPDPHFPIAADVGLYRVVGLKR